MYYTTFQRLLSSLRRWIDKLFATTHIYTLYKHYIQVRIYIYLNNISVHFYLDGHPDVKLDLTHNANIIAARR